MNLDFKSKYADTILSACLDSTINMWTLGPSNFSIQEHEKVSRYHRRRQDRQSLGLLSQQESCSIKHLLRCLPSQSTHPSYRSSVAVKMERPRSGKTALIASKTRSAALERARCMVCRTPQKRQRSSGRP